jgi:hypothetical protein
VKREKTDKRETKEGSKEGSKEGQKWYLVKNKKRN